MKKLVTITLLAAIAACTHVTYVCVTPTSVPNTASHAVETRTSTEVMLPITAAPNPSLCPNDMVEVNGNYCPKTDERCLYWVTIDGERTDIATDRCGEFRNPVRCLTTPIHKHFCIDRYEYPNVKGQRPQDWVSFNDAKKIVESEGKRLCTQSEWTLAAQGHDNHPYPFGDGFHRDHSCNIDNHVHGVDVMKLADPNEPGAITIHNMLTPSGSLPNCKSDYGVYDMSGNIDEWVVNESGNPYPSGLMSGHIFGVRNRSTGITTAHGPTFYWYETGLRACRDIEHE